MFLTLLTLTVASASNCHEWEALIGATLGAGHCLTPGLLQAQQMAHQRGQTHCLQPVLNQHGLTLNTPAPATTSTDMGGLELNQQYDDLVAITSEHFAVWWDPGGGLADMATAKLVAAAMEQAWSSEIETLGYPQPATTDTTYFNVYIGDSGDSAPSSQGAAGYFWTDGDGYPYIVLALSSVQNTDYLEVLTSHEFFHSIQNSTASYSYSNEEPGAWYWEATAVWMETELFPLSEYAVDLLFGLAFLPELPIDHFNYPDEGTADEYHQYGAFMFPKYLTEFTAEPSLIFDSWVYPSSNDPIVSLDALLNDWGTDVEQEFLNFAVRNTTWDYEHSVAYNSAIITSGGYSSDWSNRPTETIEESIPMTSPSHHHPSGFGANYWNLDGTPDALTVRFEARSEPSQWRVAVVVEDAGVNTYHEMVVVDDSGELTVEDIDYWADIYLVVAVTDDEREQDITYDYAIEIEYIEEETVITPAVLDPREGCGCTTGFNPGLPLLWGGLLLFARRRHQ